MRSFTDFPEDLFSYAPITDEAGEKVFSLSLLSVMSDHFVAKLKGCKTRDAADNLRGQKLFIERLSLPETNENVFYEADLVGLKALDEQGENQGVVKALYDFGGGPFLEIEPLKGKTYMLPFRDEFVPTIDLAAGIIHVLVPEGWLAVSEKNAAVKDKVKVKDKAQPKDKTEEKPKNNAKTKTKDRVGHTLPKGMA